MKHLISLLTALMVIPGISDAQTPSLDHILDKMEATNFREIQQELNTYFKANPNAPGNKQWKRREWFLEPRLYPSGESVNIAALAHQAWQKVEKESNSRATHGSWSFLGPLNWEAGANDRSGMGRVNCVKVHPTNEDIIYIGSSSGGIWKTTNGGTSWSNISPYFPVLSIADIGFDPDDPDILYVLTGDGDPSPGEPGTHGQGEVSSIGIIRSYNGGATWHPTNFSFERPNAVVPIKLLIHPVDVDIQFAIGNHGIYKTENAWESYVPVLGEVTYDIEFHPANTLIMYASGTNWIRKSVNMGDDWSTVTDDNFSILSNSSRIELAVSPENPSGVYALSGNWDDGLVGFFRSLNAGSSNTWTLRDSTSGHDFGIFTRYCVALAASPTDFSDVFGGMQAICRSYTEGNAGSWTKITQGTVHADLHDILITNNAMYVACDGGLFKSTDNGDSWTDLSPGLAITEYYRIAGTPQNTSLYYCGAQDNGTHCRTSGTTFSSAAGKDGMTPRINYRNSDTVYVGEQKGVFRRSIDGGESFQLMGIPGDGSAWVTPFIMDPVNPQVLFIGKDSLYRSDNGGWPYQYLGEPTGTNINCLAQGTSNRNRLYLSSESAIYRCDNALVSSGTASFTNIGTGLPNLFITGMVVDPDNSSRIFVTLSGFEDSLKVFFSYDAGETWNNISGDLPNIPVNCIAFDNNSPASDALYIGTDIGVFYRDLDLGDWIYYSNSMPAVIVNDLYINPTNSTITAGTFGRGLWSSSLYSGCNENALIVDTGLPLGGVRHISVNNEITSTAEYRREIGTQTYFSAGERIILNPGFRIGARAFFLGKIADCPDITLEPFSTLPQNPQGRWIGREIAEENR